MERKEIRNELSDVMLMVMSGGLGVERIKEGLDKAILLVSELGETIAFSMAWKKVGSGLYAGDGQLAAGRQAALRAGVRVGRGEQGDVDVED